MSTSVLSVPVSGPSPSNAPVWSGHAAGSRAYRRVLIALLCGGLATFAQLYAPQGVLPRIADELRITAAQASLLISASTVGLAVGVIPWAWIADRIGRVRAMKASMTLATLCGFAVTACPGFEGIVALRVLEGLALGGLPAVAITYLHEEIDRRHAAVAAALYVSGTTIGGLMGRILSAPVAEAYGWRIGVACVTAVGALATLTFFLVTPEPRGFRASSGARLSVAQALLANLRRREMVTLFLVGLLLMGANVAVYNYLTFHLEDAPFGLSPTQASLIFLAYLAGTLSSGWAGRLAAAHGRIRVLCGAIATMIAGASLMVVDALPVLATGLVVFTAGFFAAHAVASGWVGYRATAGKSQAASLYNLFYYVGSSVFGWGCGVIYGASGWTAMVISVAAMAALAAALAIRQWRADPRED